MRLTRSPLRILSLLVSSVVLAALCWSTQSARALVQTQPAKRRVRSEMLVSTNWLAEHIADDKVVVLHVAREKSHYDAGHIPGARFLPWNEMVATRDGIANELPPPEELQRLFARLGVGNTARIILYGDNSVLSAARAYFTLDYLGQGHRTALLDGGIEKWKSDGQKLSKEDVRPVEAEFKPMLNPAVVTDLRAMREYSAVAGGARGGHLTIIDSRPEDQFLGDPSAANQRSGHIPGAVSLFWVNQVANREKPTLLSTAELQTLFEKAGISEGDKVVTYCTSGVQASQSYFVARYLGYDASMYDGSFSEWSKAEGTKVSTGKSPK